MKIVKINAIILVAIFSLLTVSCQKEYIENEPEAFYDPGKRLKLNNYLLVLDDSELTHSGEPGAFYDEESQVLILDTIVVESEIDTSNVILIDREDDVLLLRVDQLTKEDGQYTIETERGFIHDVFDNVDLIFDFNPQYSDDKMKSASLSQLDNETLSQELTDNKNAIHPSEIRMIVGNTEQVIFSVDKDIPLTTTKSATSQSATNNDGRVGFDHQFNTNKTIVEVGPVKLQLEDFGFSWYSDLKANLSTSTKYKHHKVCFVKCKEWDTAYEKDVDFTLTATNMDIEAWFDIAAVINGKLPLVSETDPIVNLQLQFEFPVGAVPVILGVEFGLDLGVDISVEGAMKASTGYTVKYNIPKMQVGAHGWVRVPDAWHHGLNPKYDYTEGHIVEQKIHPLKLEAMATLKQVYTLKPTMGISAYRAAGPEINLAIGTEVDFSVGGGVSIDLTKPKAPEAYVGWGSKWSTKVGAGGGVWIDCFGLANKHLDIPTLSLLPSIPIWHTPESMKKTTDNDFAQTVVGEAKEVEVEVKDSWTIPAPAMFISWESRDYIGEGEVSTEAGGYWEYPITVSGIDGKTKNTWHPTKAGDHKPYCMVKNGKLKLVAQEIFTTTTYEN
nr:hypothetical protein [uncultured Draconibacterium sp.]